MRRRLTMLKAFGILLLAGGFAVLARGVFEAPPVTGVVVFGLGGALGAGGCLLVARFRQPDAYRALFDRAPHPVQILRPDGHFAYVNPAWLDALGYTTADVRALALADVLHPDSRVQGLVLFDRAVKGAPIAHFAATFQTRDGRALPLEGTLHPCTGTRGRVVTLHALLHDVTAQRAREAALERARDAAEAADRAKSLFLATMSHELRTPMNGVLGMADLLRTTPLSETQREFVETIHLSGATLLTVINDILDFSKIEAGKLELELRPVAPRTVVSDALSIVSAHAQNPALTLRTTLDADVPALVRTDEVRLRQVLVNLLANAIKFTDAGEVEVAVQPRGPRTLAFSVRDTGPGIPADRMHRLFHSFSQADASTTRKYGGTGLGLAISKKLVEALGGDIHVDSTEGEGTTFTFTIDALAVTPQPDAPATADAPAVSVSSLRVLLAEDHAVNQRVVLRMLERLGIEADLAENGVEAVRLARQRPYDVILMDVQMPEMDGHDAARTLRQTLPVDQQPYIVALTANALPEDEARSREAGMDAHLAKPIQLAALCEALKNVPVLA